MAKKIFWLKISFMSKFILELSKGILISENEWKEKDILTHIAVYGRTHSQCSDDTEWAHIERAFSLHTFGIFFNMWCLSHYKYQTSSRFLSRTFIFHNEARLQCKWINWCSAPDRFQVFNISANGQTNFFFIVSTNIRSTSTYYCFASSSVIDSNS